MSELREYALVAGIMAALTCGCLFLPPQASMSVGLLYLLAVVLLSLRVGRWPMLVAGLMSALCWEYFFVEPRFQLRLSTLEDALMVSIYLVVALVAGQLAARIRKQARDEKLREESDRLHRTLLDSVSHELRTPLAVITAALENLEGALPDAAPRLIEEMRTAVRRLNRRVSDLLDQTRLESGALKPRLDWCDASDLINAATECVRDTLAGHPYSIAVPDDMPPVRADFGLTEHALANLILNAALHTPAGTPIRVTTGVGHQGKRVFFSVTDQGPGLPPALRDRLFQKFARGDAARAGGLGLGLSIARGFVTAQGGDILLGENTEGGAVFTIYLHHSAPQPDSQE